MSIDDEFRNALLCLATAMFNDETDVECGASKRVDYASMVRSDQLVAVKIMARQMTLISKGHRTVRVYGSPRPRFGAMPILHLVVIDATRERYETLRDEKVYDYKPGDVHYSVYPPDTDRCGLRLMRGRNSTR